MIDNGWVKTHRTLKGWRWYRKSKHVHLFIHMLIEANYEDKYWQRITIKRGQFVTGRKSLSANTGISERSIRTILNDLKTTNEVTIKSYSKFSIITITNYELYQQNDQQNDQQVTSKRPLLRIKELKNNTNTYSPIEASEIVDYLNHKINSNYKPNSKSTLSVIKSRIDEGATLDDFKKVIDLKSGEWLGTDMAKFLRPITLFGNKFESYLNDPSKKYPTEDEIHEKLLEIERTALNGTD